MKSYVQLVSRSFGRTFKTKSGADFTTYRCQCVVLQGSADEVVVGVLGVPDRVAEESGVLAHETINGQKASYIPAGLYELEYGLAVSYTDRTIGGQLKRLRHLSKGADLAIVLEGFNEDTVIPPSQMMSKDQGKKGASAAV